MWIQEQIYLEEELSPATVPSLWLNEVGRSEKLIPAESLGFHSRQGDSHLTAGTCPVTALGTDRLAWKSVLRSNSWWQIQECPCLT